MEPWGIRTLESLEAGGLRFETVEYLPGHWAARHAHDVAFADLLLAGAQDARWNGADVRRAPGTLALMPRGEAHATASGAPTRTFQIVLGRDAASLGKACAHFDAGPLAWRVTRMWAEFRRRDDLTAAVLEGRVRGFLDAFAGAGLPQDEGAARWLRRAHDYVRAHAREGFAIADVAAAAGVDPAHLMRSYARRYGATIGDDARRLRVAHACRLLAGAAPALGEVALSAGFADQSHLNRVFKRLTGLTPLEYRRACLGVGSNDVISVQDAGAAGSPN